MLLFCIPYFPPAFILLFTKVYPLEIFPGVYDPLRIVNSLSLYMSENVFILPTLLNDNLVWNKILSIHFIPLHYEDTAPLFTLNVANEKSDVSMSLTPS